MNKMKDSLSAKSIVKSEPVDSFSHKQSHKANKDSTVKNTNEDMQRAIEGLKEIPDEELQEFLDDEDFMQGLDVVDTWEGDEEKIREVEHKTIHVKEREQRHPSRDRYRRDRKGSYSRERPKREEKKHEETRRDPSKSTKDIEKDKIRTKRDNESKLLAEKEKAIKHLLDSDNVVPPGTEVEAIQSITEKQNLERAQLHVPRSRERRRSLERQHGSSLRRRSPERIRLSPPRRRSPLLPTPDRGRSPFRISNDRHRSPRIFSPDKRRSPLRFNVRRSPHAVSPERRRSPIRRPSWERRTSVDRRWSAERHRRRVNVHERRRSRSRDRQRSRSTDRPRRKATRSPIRRYSPRRRSRTRSRSLERRRKRSPFINELARQLRNESMMATRINTGYNPPMEGIQPMVNQVYPQEVEPRPVPMSYMPPVQTIPSSLTGTGPFLNFENSPQINFESVPMHPMPQVEYSSGPVMYNQNNSVPAHRPPLLPAPVPSPQPVPPMDHVPSYGPHGIPATRPQSPTLSFDFLGKSKSKNKIKSTSTGTSTGACASTSTSTGQNYKERRSTTPYNGYRASQERLKTPEPPVISDTKQFEKTSLSSLLEASVSAKDSTSLPVLYPGFKPEILRHCDHALRELPMEDPRLKMKGRFFYDPTKEDIENRFRAHSSNSILLQKGKNKIYWEEDDTHHIIPMKHTTQTRQKICQTDEVETDTKFVQASVTMVDCEVQVYPQDLEQPAKEEKRPIMDRLDWNMRETFDYTPKFREADDLRWSLSNSSQKRSWSRTSPIRSNDRDRLDMDHNSRNVNLDSPGRTSEFSHNSHFRDRYSPSYRHLDERDDFLESRSDHSCDESPIMPEDSGEELEDEHTFRESDWHGRGKMIRGGSSPLMKPNVYRGKHGGRPYRGRGFHGKF